MPRNIPPKTRQVYVTQEDIDDGIPNDPTRCAVQLACSRAFPDADKTKVLSGALHVSFKDETWMYRLPKTVTCIPTLVDLGMKNDAEPLSFKLERPLIYRRNHKAKPISVKAHQRALPGDGKQRHENTSAKDAAKRMRAKLSELGYGSRYAGNEI